jgi:SAM-dependent methyltransferase
MGICNRDDRRSQASRKASAKVLALCEAGGVVLGLGGGPLRVHPRIKNLNIEPFENVDIVGDAHNLPLPSSSIDGVHCEAVFEHLEQPVVAAAEMFCVMKPGALAFVCTPFLQGFHGYPSHYQNFTHIGNQRLFERAGFKVLESGVAVGPGWAISDIMTLFVAQYTPRLLNRPARVAWRVIANALIRPLDKWLSERPDAYVVASTTYVLLARPENSD